MEEKRVLKTYEQKRQWVRQFTLTSDLFAGKVFEDLQASQELCRILMQQPELRLKSVRTQYVIRNLESHSVQLDILAEEDNGNVISVELQKKKGVDIMCEIADRIRREGKIEGKIEDILELLEELGKIPTKIAQRIRQETNLNVLARWHRCAAKASSISEFEDGMTEAASGAGSGSSRF